MGNYDTGATTLGNFGNRNQAPAVKHPAKFSKTVWLAIYRDVAKLVDLQPDREEWSVLDPFAGVGGIFDLHTMEMDYDAGELLFKITGIEIEEEWAEAARHHERYRAAHDQIIAMDFFDFAMHPSVRDSFDIIITSPTYGNRMADHHEAKDDSKRNTYRHTLGRPLTEGSSAGLQWGDEYREFHRNAWEEVYRLLKPGGYFILNVKDHIRKGEKQPVSAWHRACCERVVGFTKRGETHMSVRGNRQGENHEARVDHEHIYLFQKEVEDGTADR